MEMSGWTEGRIVCYLLMFYQSPCLSLSLVCCALVPWKRKKADEDEWIWDPCPVLSFPSGFVFVLTNQTKLDLREENMDVVGWMRKRVNNNTRTLFFSLQTNKHNWHLMLINIHNPSWHLSTLHVHALTHTHSSHTLTLPEQKKNIVGSRWRRKKSCPWKMKKCPSVDPLMDRGQITKSG